jgi:hypothetical protein
MPEAKLREKGDDELDDFAWLGREFLTWLLWRVDAGEPEFRAQGGAFSVGFGGRVRLSSNAGFATDLVLKGQSPAHGAEARAAVGSGHTLREAELRVARGDREWRFTLQADTLDVKSVKLPTALDKPPPAEPGDLGAKPGRFKKKRADVDEAAETDARRAERLALLEELDDLVRAAYAEFVRERTRPTWRKSVVPALREWLAGGLTVE